MAINKCSQYNIEKRPTEDEEEDEDDDYTFGPRPKQEDNQAPMLSKKYRNPNFYWLLEYFFFYIHYVYIEGF